MLNAPQARAVASTTIAAAVLLAATAAHAGTVSGKVDLPAASPPALRDAGFLDRVDNPYMPIRAIDPTPLIVVVLEPAAPAPPPAKTGSAQMVFLGGSFDKPLIAVVPGTEITIKSCGACPDADLTVPDKPDLIEKATLSANGAKVFKAAAPGAIVIHDGQQPGLRG